MDQEQVLRQAEALVDQMTVEEQASQLRYDAPAIERLNIPAYNWWNEALHGVARAGTATVFPQAITLAASFDTHGMRTIADIIATEGRAKYRQTSARGDRDIYKGLTFWSPNVNIFRDPRWGRGQETYGEDPYLTARLGVAFVKGLQGEDEGEGLKAAACAKHFAVHSGPEADRHRFDAKVSQKDLRETYLPAFEALVKEAKVEAVMGAYNRVNGEPCCGSETLLVKILRDEWGFQGHVVSDCWAIKDFHEFHKVTDTAPESAALAIKNGCDLNCGVTYLHLLTALKEGMITSGMIRTACVRLMATRIRLGILGGFNVYAAISDWACDSDANDFHALRAAEAGMVLLKNDGVLPLDPAQAKTVAVVGPAADSRRVLEGNYNGTSSRYVTFLDGLRKALAPHDVRLLYAQGSQMSRDRDTGLSQRPHDRLTEAVWAAERADVTILCVGLDATMEGEEGDTGNAYFSGDKGDLELPECQRVLLDAMRKHAKKLITVFTSGSALNVTAGDAILWAGYPGQAGGTALARILTGKTAPSGRLPVTFYKSVSDLPDFHDYAMTGRTYRYFKGEALYPFGYGLGYGRVTYAKPSLESDGTIHVEGHYNGSMNSEQVTQVYVRAHTPLAPPNPRLCGFSRDAFFAGQRREIRIPLDRDWAFVINDAGEKVPFYGRFTLYVGASQPDALSVSLTGQAPLTLDITLDPPGETAGA